MSIDLIPGRVEKPWGHEEIWYHGAYTAKTIHVLPGHRLSLQLHQQKIETMIVQSGHPIVQVGDQVSVLAPGDVVHIDGGTVHRLQAPADESVSVFEVATPQLDDIVRLEDDYGRDVVSSRPSSNSARSPGSSDSPCTIRKSASTRVRSSSGSPSTP